MSVAGGLFAEHRDGVFRYLCRAVGQADAARDLTQEVFLRVSRARTPDMTDEGRKAWVFTIARHVAINHARDERRRPSMTALVDSPRAATQEISAAVRQALAGLDQIDRDVFLLRELAGLGYDDIAAACDLSPDAVRSRIHRARQRLRTDLGGSIATQRQQGIRNGHP